MYNILICYLKSQKSIITLLLQLENRFQAPKYNATNTDKYDCPNRLNFDSTAFATPKSYVVAANFDSAYAATVNVAKSDTDAATTSDTSIGITAV